MECSTATSVHYRISSGQHMVPMLWWRKGKSRLSLSGVLNHATGSSQMQKGRRMYTVCLGYDCNARAEKICLVWGARITIDIK